MLIWTFFTTITDAITSRSSDNFSRITMYRERTKLCLRDTEEPQLVAVLMRLLLTLTELRFLVSWHHIAFLFIASEDELLIHINSAKNIVLNIKAYCCGGSDHRLLRIRYHRVSFFVNISVTPPFKFICLNALFFVLLQEQSFEDAHFSGW